MRICVIGAGPAGSAHAAILARSGHDVALFKSTRLMNEEHFDAIAKNRAVTLIDRDGSETTAPIRMATRDPQEAFARPYDAIVVMTQSFAHHALASALKKRGARATMLLTTSSYLGSVLYWRALKDRVAYVVEGESPPYDARITRPGAVRICFKNARNALGVLPRAKTSDAIEFAARLFDASRYSRRHVVESALRNPNLILHTTGTILSASRIERSGGEFWMYREAFTESVWRVVEKLDQEKSRVLEKLGCEKSDYFQDCQFRNAECLDGDPRDAFLEYAAKGGPKGPSSLATRFLTEDAPNGLGLLISLGETLNVKTPVARALLTLADALLDDNLFAKQRTLHSLGIESYDDLMKLVSS